MLTNRAQRVLKNTNGESNWTFGLEISLFTDQVLGLTSSSNFGGIWETDHGLVVIGNAVTLNSMRVLGESSTRRDGPPTEKNDAGLSSWAGNQITEAGSWCGVARGGDTSARMGVRCL